jgi:hypothetical protein
MRTDPISFITFATVVTIADALRRARDVFEHAAPVFATVSPDTQGSRPLPPDPERHASAPANDEARRVTADEAPGIDRYRRAVKRWLAWFDGRPRE